MKTILLATLLATASLISACATDKGAPDELDGESDLDGESGKGDTADAFTYFLVTPDTRACSFDAECGGFFVSRPNKAKTTCIDGTSSSRCYVPSIDWSGSGMLQAITQTFENQLRDGAPVLLRGSLGNDTGARAIAKLATNIAPLLAPAQPMLDIGGGPDCLYAKLTVTNVTMAKSSITVTPSTGTTSAVRARFSDVTITASSAHAATCVDGTAPVVLKLARVEITGSLTNADRALQNPTVDVSGVVVDAPQLPSVIRDLLDLEGRAGGIVAQTTALSLAAVTTAEVKPNIAVTEIWAPGSETGVIDGVLVLAKDNGVRCITAPCPSITEVRVNANRSAAIHSVDLEASGADEATVSSAMTDIASGSGVIIAGDRFYTDGGRGKSRRANQFWTRAR